MDDLAPLVHAAIAQDGPREAAGVVRVRVGGDVALEHTWAWPTGGGPGRWRRTTGSRWPGSKGFTALAALSLVADGTLALDTPARSLLGPDLPLVADDVTVDHLLAHRSGTGEYLDDAYLMSVPVHALVSPEAYLPMLAGHPTQFPGGSAFTYCNGGYVLLALLVERAAGVAFQDVVRTRVLAPAGMTRTDYLRSDELPADAVTGYVQVDGRAAGSPPARSAWSARTPGSRSGPCTAPRTG